MKKILFNLSVISSLIMTPAFAGSSNACLANLQQHAGLWTHTLDLSNCNLDNGDIEEVADYVNKNKVTYLVLDNNHLTDYAAWVISKVNTPLEGVFFDNNYIGDDGLAALATMPALDTISAQNNEIHDAGAIAVSKNHALKFVVLGSNQITPVGAKALSTLPELQYIDLSANVHIGDNEAALFAGKSSLNAIALSDDEVGVMGVYSIIRNANITYAQLSANKLDSNLTSLLASDTSLQTLDISYNQIDATGLTNLAKNSSLNFVNLSGMNLHDDSAYAISKSTSIEFLNVSDNFISDKGAANLAKMNLLDLIIDKNRIGDTGAIALSKTEIADISAENNGITAKGAVALAKANNLQRLYLSGNKLGNDGAIALATPASPMLHTLDLSNTQMGDQAAVVFARETTRHPLFLNASYNHITAAGIRALQNNPMLFTNTEGNDEMTALKASNVSAKQKARSRWLAAKQYCAKKHNAFCAMIAVKKNA